MAYFSLYFAAESTYLPPYYENEVRETSFQLTSEKQRDFTNLKDPQGLQQGWSTTLFENFFIAPNKLNVYT